MAERDWANISEDEDDDHYEPQEQAPEEKPQPGYSREAYVEDNRPSNQEDEIRTSGYGYGGGDRGNRGYRGGSRGGGRGRGRGGRGGRDNRGDRGDRGDRGEREDRGERPQKQIKESQPKAEMVNLIKRARDDITFINLFDVDFKATEDDIKKLYPEVKVYEVTMVKPGLFLVELEREEALKLVDIGPKKFNQREFYMKLGYSNKRQQAEEQWHNVNKEKNRYEVGQREDKPKRGGKHQSYNRREQNQFGDEASPRPRYQNENRNREYQEKKTSEQIDTDNKFFRGHDLKASEFKLKFTNSSTKKDEEGSTPQPKPVKPNPFGEAVARDEQEYLRKKDDEKKQVQEMQKHFEEKKDQQQTQIQPEIPKEQPKLKLTAPVSSVDSQHVVDFNHGERKGESRRQYEDKGRYDQGGYGKGYKKSGFTGKGQVVYEVKAKDKAAEYYGEDNGQKNRGQDEGRWQPKDRDRGYGNNKYNKFDILK